MPVETSLQPTDFYNTHPTLNHRTGDIWHALPTFGMLSCKTCSGVVITPACDLANKKSETVTYLPIISVRRYLCSLAFRHEVWQEVTSSFDRLGLLGLISTPSRYRLITSDEAQIIGQLAEEGQAGKQSSEFKRILNYLEYVEASRNDNVSLAILNTLFKSDRLEKLKTKIVTNALKVDTHFFPADLQPTELSAIQEHSVALFRYALTIPIEVLDLAQSVDSTQWAEAKANNRSSLPVLDQVIQWPIKLNALRSEFLGDLLSRFVAMQIRLGSADFSDFTATRMAQEIAND